MKADILCPFVFFVAVPLRNFQGDLRQLIARRLFRIANEQQFAGEAEVVPGLPLKSLDFSQFAKLFGIGSDQRQLPAFAEHQDFVADAEHLAVAITPFFPLRLERGNLHAFEHAVREAIGMFANDRDVGVLRLEDARVLLERLDLPRAADELHFNEFGPDSISLAEEQAIGSDHVRLRRTGGAIAPPWPWMRPKFFPRLDVVTSHGVFVDDDKLPHAAECEEAGGRIADLPLASFPNDLSRVGVVGDEGLRSSQNTSRGNDHQVVHHQRRVRPPPHHDFLGLNLHELADVWRKVRLRGLRIRRAGDKRGKAVTDEQIVLPDQVPGRAIETLQNASRPEDVHLALVNRRRGPRTDSARDDLMASDNTVSPNWSAGAGVIACHPLFVPPLLHRHGVAVDDAKGRPARADFPPPQLLRRSWFPVHQRRSREIIFAAGTEELREVGVRRFRQIDLGILLFDVHLAEFSIRRARKSRRKVRHHVPIELAEAEEKEEQKDRASHRQERQQPNQSRIAAAEDEPQKERYTSYESEDDCGEIQEGGIEHRHPPGDHLLKHVRKHNRKQAGDDDERRDLARKIARGL